jgi:hypothetical protein
LKSPQSIIVVAGCYDLGSEDQGCCKDMTIPEIHLDEDEMM